MYAKCAAMERLRLCNDIYNLGQDIQTPWLVGGDFNVIEWREEDWGTTCVPTRIWGFCINSCELFDVPFTVSPFTWWNRRADEACIFKRLDKVVVNYNFQDVFGNTDLQHLARIGSDHAPLLITYGT